MLQQAEPAFCFLGFLPVCGVLSQERGASGAQRGSIRRGDMAQPAECFHPPAQRLAVAHTSGIPELGSWRQEDQELQVIFRLVEVESTTEPVGGHPGSMGSEAGKAGLFNASDCRMTRRSQCWLGLG